MSKHIDIFIAYAHEDEKILEELKTHLTVLERTQNVTIWYDGLVMPGQEWQATTKQVMQKSQVILLLISADFIASDECYNENMKHALDMHRAGKCTVIPVLARACLWQDTPFSSLQILPKNQQPLTSAAWQTHEDPFTQVAENLRSVVQKLQGNVALESSVNPIATPTATETARFSMRIWYFVGGGVVALVAALFAYNFFNSRAIEKELLVKVAQYQQDSVKAVTDFKFLVELGDNELANMPSKDDYLKAMTLYDRAANAVGPFRVNVDAVKAKIQDCKKHISAANNVDTFYVNALLKYSQKINEAHKLFRVAAALKGKKQTDEIVDAFRKSKNMYDEAILAAGKKAIDVSAAQEGRYACDEETAALYPQPMVVVEAPKTTSNEKRLRKKNIDIVIPKVQPAKVKDMSNWKRSMEKNVKLEEVTEKYNKKEE